jgi:hypothetical protein
MQMLPSAVRQSQLKVVSSLVSPRVDSHVCDPKDGPGYHLSIRGWGTTTGGALVQNTPMPPGLGGMTPLSRSDPVLRFVRSGQRFVCGTQAQVNCQFRCHVDPEEWGRELGVLKPYGSVVEVED